jgi:hypothetical protein
MKKKILSAILALTMVMGISVASFAEDATLSGSEAATGGQAVTVSSTTTTPTIKVVVPTTAAIIINPFQLEVDIDGAGSGQEKSTDQIISPVYTIKSESNVDIAVNVSTFKVEKKTGSSDIAFVSKSAKSATAKSAYIYLFVADEITSSTATTTPTLVATAAGASKNAVATIVKGGDAEAPKKVQFKLCGDVNANPTKTENKVTTADPWKDADGVTIDLKFTFTPQIISGT